ncbi:MAG: glycerophosphoryl diester phosphodiesterase membrane domain-containing protein [Lapillicoccus sp.]
MSGVTGFGPPPGSSPEPTRRRPPSYLPPGGLTSVGGSPPGAAAGGGAPAYASGPGLVGARRGSMAMTSSHKPGIIPLRPMALGDLLDGAVKHVRRNPGPVLGMTFLVLGVGVVPAVLLSGTALVGSWFSALDIGSVLSTGELSGLLLVLGVWFATLVLCGVLAQPVAEATLGRRLDLGQIWSSARPRLLRLLGLQVLVVLLDAVPVGLVVLALVLLQNAPGLLLVVVAVAGLVLTVAWTLFVAARTVLAGPALVLERKGVRAALRRGWALSRGSFWRVGGTTLLVGFIAGIVFVVVELPLFLLLTLLTVLLDLSGSAADAAGSLVVNLATLIAAAFVVPVIASAVGLIYVDQRMRKEGFDLVLLRAASSRPGVVR